jgi:cyclohexadienyl dehydratase
VTRLHRARAAALALLAAVGCAAGPAPLRVGTSFDYAPFSQGSPAAPAGLDVELLRAYAEERGLAVEWVRFRWPDLVADLTAGRFDVAAGGVTVRPERSVAGRFSVPVATTGAVALLRDAVRFRTLADLDRDDVRIAVNAGGHLERVGRQHFPAARLVPIEGNARVPEALRRGEVDAVLTDSAEAPTWRAALPGLAVLGPFTRDRKAWLVQPWRPELATDLDRWLLEREADGRLAVLRAAHLGAQAEATALPLPALLAALCERLDLAALVAESKRGAGLPVRDVAQEERVQAAALAAARDEARQAGMPPPDEAALGRLFTAVLAASRELQSAALAGPPAPGARFDLDAQLRPALGRVSERVARLAVRVAAASPPASDAGDAGPAIAAADRARQELARPGLPEPALRALADAVAALTPGRAPRAAGRRLRRGPVRAGAAPGRRSLRA